MHWNSKQLVETVALNIALANNGGDWAEHYSEVQKEVWRERARFIVGYIWDQAFEAGKKFGRDNREPPDA